MRLENKRVLIVGGSHGMVLGAARVASEAGVGYQGNNRDIGLAVVFLMSNPYMTGQVLEIDGGTSIKL
jgi:NAD(P)-dependent dehydrogenase (short-subunit alcohol dehydrogenase family)